MARKRKRKPLYTLRIHTDGQFVFSEQLRGVHIFDKDYDKLLDKVEDFMGRNPGILTKSKRVHAGCDMSEQETTIEQERRTGF